MILSGCCFPPRLLRGLDQLPPRGVGSGAAPHAAGTEGAGAGPVSHLLPEGGATGGAGAPPALRGRHPQRQQGTVVVVEGGVSGRNMGLG